MAQNHFVFKHHFSPYFVNELFNLIIPRSLLRGYRSSTLGGYASGTASKPSVPYVQKSKSATVSGSSSSALTRITSITSLVQPQSLPPPDSSKSSRASPPERSFGSTPISRENFGAGGSGLMASLSPRLAKGAAGT